MSNWDDLVGHPYEFGLWDCYTCARQFYWRNGLQLPNFARPTNFWQDPNLDLYGAFREFGFQLVFDDTPELGDLLLMPLLSAVNSHAAVVVGDNQILHHPPGQLSRIDPYRPKWSNRTTIHARHPNVFAALKAEITPVHAFEVLDAHVLRDPAVQEQLVLALPEGR